MALPKNHRLLTAAVGMLVACTFGCSASHSTPTAAATSTSPLLAAATPQTSTTPALTSSPGTSFCPVPNPPALTQAETAGAVPTAPGSTLVPAAVAPDGSSFFAMTGTSVLALKNLIWFRNHGASQQNVFTLAAPYAGYGAVSFDGRWLIFMANHAQQLTGAWDLYAWDSQGTAAPHIIATDPGTAPNSPIEWPQARDGKATWLQGLPDGTRQVHLYDFATSHDRVIHSGHVGTSLLGGGLLIWTEALQPNAPTTLAAASTTTGTAAPVPTPLATAQTAPATLATDGTTWAWTTPDYRTLYAWHTGMPTAVTVHTADQGDAMDSLGVSGDIVTWTNSTATFAANLRNGSYTQLTKQYGSALTNGSAIAVYYPLGDPKSPGLRYDVYVLKASDLSGLPKCSA